MIDTSLKNRKGTFLSFSFECFHFIFKNQFKSQFVVPTYSLNVNDNTQMYCSPDRKFHRILHSLCNDESI